MGPGGWKGLLLPTLFANRFSTPCRALQTIVPLPAPKQESSPFHQGWEGPPTGNRTPRSWETAEKTIKLEGRAVSKLQSGNGRGQKPLISLVLCGQSTGPGGGVTYLLGDRGPLQSSGGSSSSLNLLGRPCPLLAEPEPDFSSSVKWG